MFDKKNDEEIMPPLKMSDVLSKEMLFEGDSRQRRALIVQKAIQMFIAQGILAKPSAFKNPGDNIINIYADMIEEALIVKKSTPPAAE